MEVGAADGEITSNTLCFETLRGWGGLLIEANPGFFENLVGKHRNAYAVNACLSPVRYSTMLNFSTAYVHGGLVQHMEDAQVQWIKRRFKGNSTTIEIPCFPLLSILLALNVSHIDYFSLDVEGAELRILNTIPFDRITFDVLRIEYRIVDCEECSEKKRQALTELVCGSGPYKLEASNTWDLFFVRS